MACIVLVRNPSGNIVVIDDGEGEWPRVAVFDDADDAEEMAHDQPLCQVWDYQVVELDI